MDSQEDYLQDEAELIENSGEIPEVAFHESVSYLTEQEDGPNLTLTPADIELLEDAVMRRYKIIILRDLDHANRRSSIFRGMKRAIINYERLKKYQRRKNRAAPGWKEEFGQAFISYIDRECRDISEGRLYRTINCGRKKIEAFANELGVNIDSEHLDLCFKQIPLTFDEVYRATLLAEKNDYPFKFLHDRGDCFEIVMLNKSKKQFPVSLKIFCGDGTKRKEVQLKVDAIYRSIPKFVAPWDVS
ncbi:MAG: hypothetical protein ABIF87_00590 [Pseudomonadota bacterium]